MSFKTEREWREWLRKNHRSSAGVWLILQKRSSKKLGLRYDDALDEALCFGWIDSRLERIDDEKHALRFTPRKSRCIWSERNRLRAEELISAGRMTTAGLAKIDDAKKNGQWEAAFSSKKIPPMPKDLEHALKAEPKALSNFRKFAPSYRLAYIYWVVSAKRAETRMKRIREVVRRADLNKRPYVP